MIKRLLLLLPFLIWTASTARGSDIYIAQNHSGSADGTNCSNARDVNWFNDSSNWGSGSWQIGAGTTAHLCGQFVGSPGQQMLLVRGSGAPGHPVTIKFEPGSVFTAPYWSSQGAIYADGSSYLVIDGANSGIIENSANGTGLAYQQESRAIYAPNCNNCTVQHITMQNIYVRTSNADVRPNQTALACVYWVNSNNFTITYTTCHDAGWAYPGYGNNFTLDHSWLYNIDHGVAFGPSGLATGFSIHDNHFWNYSNWDSAQNFYHHDGIHIWGRNGGRVANGVIYNNRFDGDCGANITAHIYLQDSIENVAVYNNVFIVPPSRTMIALWFAAGTNVLPGGLATGNSAFNNFINAGGHRQGAAMFIQGQYNFTGVNNVLIGGQSDITIAFGGTLSSTGLNNNIYLDLQVEAGNLTTFSYQSSYFTSLSAWRSACHCDRNSKVVSLNALKASSVGQLLTGSAGIGAGSNLTNLATGSLVPLVRDLIGTNRPNSSNWDAGAYQTVNGVPRLLAPAGLAATVN